MKIVHAMFMTVMITLITTPLVLALVFQPVKVGYTLQTVDLRPQWSLHEYPVLGHERFISYSDCRDRGLSNVALLENVGIKAGFVCINMEKEDGNAKESLD